MRNPVLKKLHAVDVAGNAFLHDVLKGLGCNPKHIPSKYFYDVAGSKLFDEICTLEEYYPYHTELKMLPLVCNEVTDIIGGRIDVIEPGAGALAKIRILLEHLQGVCRYIPIDISGDYLRMAAMQLDQEFRHLEVIPVAADFTRSINLPDKTDDMTRLGFFPGSTIGNFSPVQAGALLDKLRQSLGHDAWLLIGVDMKKSPLILHQAYNDSAGVTAKFNKNLLIRINRELDGNFDSSTFEHYAFYHAQESRIEMHLVSSIAQKVSVGGICFSFQRGESIHTENSYKYSPADFMKLAAAAGWQVRQQWQDEHHLFSHYLLHCS